jgi:hypothetical protein
MIKWIIEHPAEGWFITSAFLNLALRVRTPEQWIALGEAHPLAAMLIRQVRALGVDPAKALLAARTYLDQRNTQKP